MGRIGIVGAFWQACGWAYYHCSKLESKGWRFWI